MLLLLPLQQSPAAAVVLLLLLPQLLPLLRAARCTHLPSDGLLVTRRVPPTAAATQFRGE
jgi:hypothetical protein